MTLFGSEFSAAFAEVVLMVDAIIIALVAAVVIYNRVAIFCIDVPRRLSAVAAFLIAHLGPRH